MYQHILITLENTPADQTILDHICPLARMMKSKILLLHVADGWVARQFLGLEMPESDEMKGDYSYLQKRADELRADGLDADAVLARGNPSTEIIRISREKKVDLIAMTTHGHRFIKDIIYGSTADKVRHQVDVPVLLLKMNRAAVS
ncbi:MAG: universal stress protein [Chthoniobacterales bacterium]